MSGWWVYSLQFACEFAVAPVNGVRNTFSVSGSQTNQNADPYERRMIVMFTVASKGLDLVSSSFMVWNIFHHLPATDGGALQSSC